MTILALCVLALVQGITEFLPISSSAHLILVPVVADWPDQGVMIDVAVHVGTLGAVILYWRQDVAALIRGFGSLARAPSRRPQPGDDGHLLLALIVASFPVVVAGGLLAVAGATEQLRSAAVIGWASIVFGVVLQWADTAFPVRRHMADLNLASAFLIGLAQVLALIPGTSRAGITMTAARMLGFSRTASAHFSMLLAIPTMLAAGTLAALSIMRAHDAGLGWDALLAAAMAFAAALCAIAFLMRWLRRASFLPFVVYRVALGAVLLLWVYL